MTPFGLRLRALRRERGVTQKQMAEGIGVSPAYLSALEHGRRGSPSWATMQAIIGYLNVIWDEAEDLQKLAAASRPRVLLDTSGLSPEATELANLLAAEITSLEVDEIAELLGRLKEIAAGKRSGMPTG